MRYNTHSCFFSLTLHSSQRSELGRTERLLETTSGYCVQFLHQCHRSGSAPLTYSSIPTLPNGKLCCNSYFSFAFCFKLEFLSCFIGQSVLAYLECLRLFD